MADNALKTPFSTSVGEWTDNRANNFTQVQAKGIPCRVVKIDKDIVTVAFEGSNGVWTMPQMKMTQAFSPYGRDPTQVGDKGYASPGDYNLGDQTGLGGKNIYSSSGNLTPLVFHPISRTNSEKRDYDQYTGAGGPSGMKFLQNAVQPKDQTVPGTPTPKMLKALLGMGSRSRQAWINRPAPLDDTQGGQQQQDNRSYMEINKNGRIAHRSKTGKVSITADENANKLTLRAPASDGMVFVGGNGVNTGLYGPIVLASPMGLMITCNSRGKWQRQDEKDELAQQDNQQ